MKTKSILLVSFIFSFQFLFASAIKPLGDTARTKYSKLTQDDFLSRYGKDDSSTAMINYYFFKREKLKKSLLISGAALVVSITITAIVAGNFEPGLVLKGVLLAVLAGAIIFSLLFIFVSAFFQRSVLYSKKGLATYLKAYHKGKPLPERIRGDKMYQSFVIAERLKRK